MDKNTLSSYGWIVVLILILSVLLAFMTPLGSFIAGGFKSITGGFIDTNNVAMEQVDPNTGKIPVDQCSHENTELQNQKSASCKANGYTGDEVCKDCNTTIKTGTAINKTDHTPVTDNAIPATCEQKGKTEGSHCSVCNTKLVAQRETDALGHDWGDPYIAEQVTCLGNGISRIECKREGCDAHTDTTITAKGHTIVTMKGKAATCTATGLTDGEKCSTCGTVTKAQTTIKALGHTAVTDKAVSATCTTDGKTEGSHCSVCNTVIKAQSTVSALGHQMGDPVVTLNATCESAGQTKTSCKRAGCGYYEVGSISAKGHTTVIDKAIAATCEKTGKTEGSHCSTCNATIKAQTTIPALGHAMSDPIITTMPTCTADGYQKIECTRNGCDYEERSTINKTGHTTVVDNAVPATCTIAGKTEGSHCSVCNTVIKAQETVPALGHNLGAPKVIANPTCTTDGQEEERCMRTDCTYVKYTTLNKTGHKEVTDKAVSATCTTDGKTAGSHCSVCSAVLKAQTTIPALGHAMSDPIVTTAPTCTADGYQKIECTRSGCDYEERSTINKTGHKEVTDFAVPATCVTAGKTEGSHCSVCGAITKIQTTIAALGHKYNSVVVKVATCTEEGLIRYTCIRNDHTYTETTPALGHTDVDPADNNCDRCGDVIKEVPGLGEVEVNNPDADITYDPDTGEAGGVIPPAEDEPEVPADIPEEKLPEFIEFNYGNFESNTTYTPGTYETVPYETTYTKVKYPVSYQGWIWSKWHITKVDNQIVSVVPFEITLADIDTKYSEYILYDFETDEYLEMEGVKGDSVYLWTIYDSSKDTKENIIYLAAYLNKLENNPNRHVAKWDGTKYVAVNYDAEIAAVDTFTETYTVTGTKQVQITAPSTNTTYVYVPVGTMQAEEGMTWAEWLASDYNTTGETAPTIKTADFEDVSYDDVIVAGENYGFYQQTSEYTLSGVWTFVDVPDNTTKMVQELSFTSCGVDFAAIEIGNYEGILYFTNKWETYCSWNAFMDEWEIDGCNTVDFGSEPQAVSQEFYEWFIVNATKQ